MWNFILPSIKSPEGNIKPGITHRDEVNQNHYMSSQKMMIIEQTTHSPTKHNNVLHSCITNDVEILQNGNISATIFSGLT